MLPGTTLQRRDTHYVSGFTNGGGGGGGFHHFINALLATALFQCWQYIVGFAAWATLIVCLSKYVHDLSVQNTLLTVLGTVLGFVISYRTSSSFERYNEGRRYWSTIIYNSRTMARAVWFHVPDVAVTAGANDEEKRARTLVEKKTVLNLTEAFAVAVKHYLRGEEGIRYEDLYHLTKYLPAYALPAGMPEQNPGNERDGSSDYTTSNLAEKGLPPPVTSPARARFSTRSAYGSTMPDGSPVLLPSRNPPKYTIWDLFPFSLLVTPLTRRGFKLQGKAAQRARAHLGMGRGNDGEVVSHNIPLEITLYLSAWIAALQQRKTCDVPTINMLLNSLNALVDSLTGLERILTTPIPFSFSVHLWTVTLLYCAALPFQLIKTMGWVTIPGTAIAAFIFTGFVVAGEEIENPFGFDRNDLNLDHFTENIIRIELASITSVPVPDPAQWAFAPENDGVFARDRFDSTKYAPEAWVREGKTKITQQLAKGVDMPQEPVKPKHKKKGVTDGHQPDQAVGHSAAGIIIAAGAAGGAADSTADD